MTGKTGSERSVPWPPAARRWGVVFTPTLLFLPETAPEDGTAAEAAVATMPGAFGKLTFLNMFRWVKGRGYAGDEHFQTYHARIVNERRAQGLPLGE
jgi:hypothetical protein